MSCTLKESCKIIIESKDQEIDRLIKERNELEVKLEEYECKENIMRIFLIIQASILAVGFQIWK